MEQEFRDRDDLVSVAWPTDSDAHMAKHELEAAGIECLLANEHYAISDADGIQLKVRRSDAEKARQILAEKVRETSERATPRWLALIILVSALVVVVAMLMSLLR